MNWKTLRGIAYSVGTVLLFAEVTRRFGLDANSFTMGLLIGFAIVLIYDAAVQHWRTQVGTGLNNVQDAVNVFAQKNREWHAKNERALRELSEKLRDANLPNTAAAIDAHLMSAPVWEDIRVTPTEEKTVPR